MTALDEFQRLEAPGIWKEGADAQRRDVIVSFGEATLTIATGAEVAVSHWSLAAIQRLNPGERPALYAPAQDDPEVLEIADQTMIAAIEKVRRSVARAGPHPRRLRLASAAFAGVAVAAIVVFWLPGAMNRYAASVVPPAKRDEIGAALLDQVTRLAGAPCSTPLGDQALADLDARLRPEGDGRIVILRSGGAPSRHLPGGIMLLDRSVVEDHEDPGALAGYILAEDIRTASADPLMTMLQHLGLPAALQLLTTGNLGPAPLGRHAEAIMSSPPEPVAEAALLARFAAAGISSIPYAYAVDISGETTLNLIEANPVDAADSVPVLDDGAWVSLQSICGS